MGKEDDNDPRPLGQIARGSPIRGCRPRLLAHEQEGLWGNHRRRHCPQTRRHLPRSRWTGRIEQGHVDHLQPHLRGQGQGFANSPQPDPGPQAIFRRRNEGRGSQGLRRRHQLARFHGKRRQTHASTIEWGRKGKTGALPECLRVHERPPGKARGHGKKR